MLSKIFEQNGVICVFGNDFAQSNAVEVQCPNHVC